MPSDYSHFYDSSDLFSEDGDEQVTDMPGNDVGCGPHVHVGVRTGCAGANEDGARWQQTPEGSALLKSISKHLSLPVSDPDVLLFAGHVFNNMRLNPESFLKVLRGASTKSDPIAAIKHCINGPELSRPSFYTLLLGGLEEPQPRVCDINTPGSISSVAGGTPRGKERG